jgi:hypothetical protein
VVPVPEAFVLEVFVLEAFAVDVVLLTLSLAAVLFVPPAPPLLEPEPVVVVDSGHSPS